MRKKLIIIFSLFVIIISILAVLRIRTETINLERLYSQLLTIKTPQEKPVIYNEFVKAKGATFNFLLKKLNSEQNDSLRVDILQIISMVGTSDDAKRILPYMSDPNCRIRVFTQDALVMMKYKNIGELLKNTIINDKCLSIRVSALRSLGDIGDESAIQFLKEFRKINNDEMLNRAIDMTLEELERKKKKNKGVYNKKLKQTKTSCRLRACLTGRQVTG